MNNTYSPEYVIELFDYTRNYLTYEECLELVSGESKTFTGTDGIEALEHFHYPTTGVAPRIQPRNLKEMPDRLAEKVYKSELELLSDVQYRSKPQKENVFKLINWLEVGEDVLGLDQESEIMTAIRTLPECESKVDMLEKHGMISGNEWYDRTEALS